MQTTETRRAFFLRYFLLAVIVVIGAWLRLYNLRANPGWYPDEGSDLNIALNLAQGRLQYFAVGGSLLVAARAPLFHLILAGLFDIFGYDILVARVVAAGAGIVTIPLLFFVLKDALGRWWALGASAFFAVFPLAVLFNRWAFAYNLLMPLFVLCFWFLLRVIETGRARWMLLAALTIALSILTAWVSVSLIICLFVVGWFYDRRALVWSLPLALSLPLAFLWLSYLYAPAAFAQDFALTFARSGDSLLVQFVFAAGNYAIFVASNYWLIPGIVGLFLIEPRRVRALVLLIFCVTLYSLLRFAHVGALGFHRVLELVPFLAIGVTVFVARATAFAVRVVSSDLDRVWVGNLRLRRAFKAVSIPIFVYLLIGSVLFFAVLAETINVMRQFPIRVEEVPALPAVEAQAAIEYVNTHARSDDVVIASPQIGWAVRARVADFQQTLSYYGFETDNYPTPLARERFVFEPTLAHARWVVVDQMWREWRAPNVAALGALANFVEETWQVAFQAGDYRVYRNPQ